MLANVVGFGGPVTVVIRRGDGYYGNSHIFRGGENLADPHLAGDEHHQYLAHAANVAATGSGIREAHEPNVRPKQRNLKTSTLAEEATLQELRVARAKAKAEALARAEQLRQQERDGIEQAAEGSAEEPSSQVKGESARRRPLMPLKKLADKVKSDREARKKAMAEKEAFEAEIEKEAFQVASMQPDEEDAPMERAHSANLVDEDDTDLEGIIAKLRQEALDRRLRNIHAAQRDNKASHQGDDLRKKAVVRDVVDDEARIRRPGIVKSRKVSTQDE